MGNVTLTDSSKVTIKDGSILQIKSIDRVAHIDPVAVHLKEVNHIDPLTIDALHITEVKNIDPIEITRFNVTNLPMVNVSLQKLPAVDINLKTLPPLSVGLHQNLCIPSSYTLNARILGIELMRLHLHGQTSIIPKDRARREQMRSDNKSFPVTSAAGNPAIPAHHEGGTNATCHAQGVYPQTASAPYYGYQQQAYTQHTVNSAHSMDARPTLASNTAMRAAQRHGTLSFGAPYATFQIPNQTPLETVSEHRVMSGE